VETQRSSAQSDGIFAPGMRSLQAHGTINRSETRSLRQSPKPDYFVLIAPSYEYANDNCGDEESEQDEEMPAARQDPEISGAKLHIVRRDCVGCTRILEKQNRLQMSQVFFRIRAFILSKGARGLPLRPK